MFKVELLFSKPLFWGILDVHVRFSGGVTPLDVLQSFKGPKFCYKIPYLDVPGKEVSKWLVSRG